MTKPKQYKIIYKQVFQKELSSIVSYILYALRNRNAARKIYKNVEHIFYSKQNILEILK